ncbi:MAG: DUF4412 domain-containing protein [Flavobacteriaceae bacterium]
MKKTIIFTICFSLFQFTLQAQKNFEGVIKFKVDFKDKTGEMTKEQIEEYIGNEQTYYLKKGRYKSEMNGSLKVTTYYNGNDTLFMKTSTINSLMYTLVTNEDEKVLSYKFSDVTETIAGVKCKLVIVKTNKGTHKYYYSKDVRIKPKFYKKHKAGLWSYFMKITKGGISIRSIADLDGSYNSIEAVSIERKKLDDSIFDRPNLPITIMPRN